MNNFESLDAWKKAHELVLLIYKVTTSFPKEEQYRLVDQIRRSASSIAANVVEGNARSYRKEYLQFVYLSRGSLEETKYHLLLARDLGYLKNDDYIVLDSKAAEVGMLMNGLIRYLRNNKQDQRPKTQDL